MAMATLIVRNIDPQLIQRLKRQAIEHGRSIEEEHRAILRRPLAEEVARVPDFKAMLLAIPAGEDERLVQDRAPGRPIDC